MSTNIVRFEATCTLPTQWATFNLHAFTELSSGKEHLAITLGEFSPEQPTMMRIHSECMTGDTLFSLRCDCGPQLESALVKIAAAGQGIILYLRQEGRGIGLVNKIKAYQLQEMGADTIEANRILGLADDLRTYSLCKPMLEHFKISTIQLLTNNPTKVKELEKLGFQVSRSEHTTTLSPFNKRYLQTKGSKMGHLLNEASLIRTHSQSTAQKSPARTIS